VSSTAPNKQKGYSRSEKSKPTGLPYGRDATAKPYYSYSVSIEEGPAHTKFGHGSFLTGLFCGKVFEKSACSQILAHRSTIGFSNKDNLLRKGRFPDPTYKTRVPAKNPFGDLPGHFDTCGALLAETDPKEKHRRSLGSDLQTLNFAGEDIY